MEEQWRFLVYYWNDKDVKDTSVNNKSYRSQQKLLHTSGRTPHYLVEQKEKQGGKKPTRIDIFVKTHTKKDGGDVNDQTAAVVTKLKELQCQEGSSSHAMGDDAIFTQVLGPERPGRTRGLGLGATKSNVLGADNNHQASTQSSTEMQKMKAKMQKMKKFLEALGYTDDSDNDLDEFNEQPNENVPDASSAHRQAGPADIGQQPQPHSEPPLLPQSIQQDNSHQCEATRVAKKRRISRKGSN